MSIIESKNIVYRRDEPDGGGSTGPICPQLPTIEEMKFFTREQRTAILDMYSMACDTYIQAAVVEEHLKGLGKKP